MFSPSHVLVAVVLAAVVSAASIDRRTVPTGLLNNKQVAYTDFTVGITACGHKIKDSDNAFYIGVDTSFGSDAACGRTLTITAPNGKTATGTVIDLGATGEGLNISPNMFKQFYNLEKGIFHGDYQFH